MARSWQRELLVSCGLGLLSIEERTFWMHSTIVVAELVQRWLPVFDPLGLVSIGEGRRWF